ncbi:uncharacterized protein LOC126815505 isoform X2 [Patella vulgata]|uniref:uncharacterized protein LOC126815505 isoform X2 n=1 Tax=Patella vulgata TaxID=6465 RepID=UPI0024A7D543|nr:uncharacterized protein LOC126815505 isoform X2 [Patella vulgata]
MSDRSDVREIMSEYWKDHAQKSSSIQTMMLDSNAEELSKDEKPEILSYLPDISGKTVIELGAGIGRFTTILAEKAKHVIAVDFMAEFIEKNKIANAHLKNIDYMVEDVTKMEQPEAQSDLVFSNWLFMYLEDAEVQKVFYKMLGWLKEGGYLFIRESCNRPSGNIPRKSNPTNYRDTDMYEAFYSSVSIPCDENHSYGFDLVLSKAVDAYIKHKSNKDQMVWLLQKVKRSNTSNFGYKNFQDFLDNQQYSKNGILRYEKVFGRTYVSTGGYETTKEFVDMLNLQAGQQVLDVGAGIGGSAFYMAKNFNVRVIANDLSSNMVSIGLDRAQEEGITPDQVVFEIADATKRDYAAESFDVIYSRDTILHINDKLSLFKRFFKWLKPGGKVLITDYCCKAGEHSDAFKLYVKQRGYNLLSPQQYGEVLKEAGLVNVRAEDKSELFTQVLEGELQKTEKMREEFIKEFSEEDYDYIVNGWKDKLVRVRQGDQRWGLFYAEKPAL